MKWTKERPTEPGWYWCKGGKKINPICILNLKIRSDGMLTCLGFEIKWDDCLWAGPIPEPEEEEGVK